MAQDEKVKQLIMEYLDEGKLMQIATSNAGRPWIATVWYAHDKDMNLYWISKRMRRHSMELEKNPNVAGTIVKPHTVGSGEKVRGLQFEGTARPCNGREFKIADELYMKKYPDADRVPPILKGVTNFIATFYVAKPSAIVLFDEINFPKDPRQELKLG